MNTLVESVDDVIYPSELGADDSPFGPERKAVREPQFIGFQCFACGQRHAELDELTACHTWLQQFWARGVVAPVTEAVTA